LRRNSLTALSTEISSFFRKSGRVIVPLTVNEILEDQIAQKLV
jgi:hypothetical protein